MKEEHGDILGRLDERSKHIASDLHNVLVQLEKLNSKVATHQDEIHQIKLKLASSQGHWTAVNRTFYIIITLTGIAAGVIATKLWH